jgi:WD repeat-containing protein 22
MCFTGVSKRERTLVKFNLKLSAQERFVRFLDVTNVAFSPSGRHVVATVSRWLPTIYDIGGPLPVCVLDHRTGPDEPETAPRYRNSVTVKTCKVSSYGGKDYFLSGSDDFSGFLWELPRSFAQLDESSLSEVGFSHEAGLLHPPIIRRANHVLLGARSITNSVLLHPTLPWAFTAGVEKVVRLHSAVPLDDKPAEPNPPKRISLVADPEGRRRVLRDIIVGDGMVEESVTADGEDERSLGFFDMLVHRESREQREGAIGSTPLVEGLLLPFGNEPDSYDEGEDACDDSDSTSDDDELDTDLEALLVEAQQAEAAAQGTADEDMGEADELRENQAGEADEGDVGEERIEKDADDETRGVKRRRSSSDS